MRRRGQKRAKIITWEFWTPKHVRRVKVPVYLKIWGETRTEGYVAVVGSKELTDTKDGWGRNVKLQEFEGTELNVIQQQVEDYLKGFSDIKWEDFLEVHTADEASKYGDNPLPSGGFSFKVSKVQIGKDSEGNEYHRASPADSPRSGRPQEGKDGEYKWMISIVPDTPAARKALQSFEDEVSKLSERVQGFLSPKNIQLTLERASLLLPAPPPKGKGE